MLYDILIVGGGPRFDCGDLRGARTKSTLIERAFPVASFPTNEIENYPVLGIIPELMQAFQEQAERFEWKSSLVIFKEFSWTEEKLHR